MRLTVGRQIAMRQALADVPALVWLFLVVLAAALLLGIAPRQFEKASNDGLRASVIEASAPVRNLTVETSGRIGAGPTTDVFKRVRDTADIFRANDLPETLESIIDGQNVVADTPRLIRQQLPGEDEPPFVSFLNLRHQQDVGSHVTVIEGRLPAERDDIELVLVEEEDPRVLPVFEIAVTERTLADLGAEIGELLIFSPDATDPAYRNEERSRLDLRLVVEISGLISLTDPSEPFWGGDSSLHNPRLVETPEFVLVFATGLMAESDYPRLLSEFGTSMWHYEFRFFTDADALTTAQVAALERDLRAVEVSYPSTGILGSGQFSFTAGLSNVLRRFGEERRAAAALLSVMAVATAGISVVLIGVLASLVAERRRRATRLQVSRGASGVQLTMSRLGEGLVVAAAGSALGIGAATAIVRSGTSPPVGTGVVCTLVSAAVYVVVHRARDFPPAVSASRTRVAAARRVVGEAALIALAAVSAVSLRRRGLVEGAVGEAGLDPLLAATPVLVGLAAGLVLLRVHRFPLAVLSWVARRRNGAVAFIGTRRALDQPVEARVPLVAILVAVALATFGAGVHGSISDGQQASSWQRVGADYRVVGAAGTEALNSAIDPTGIDAVEAVALGLEVIAVGDDDATLRERITVLAVDTVGYNDVTDGTRAATNFPDSMRGTFRDQAGSTTQLLPAILGRVWADAYGLDVHSILSLRLARFTATFVVIEVRDSVATLEQDQPFIVAELSSLDALDSIPLSPTEMLIRAPDDARNLIVDAITAQSPVATVTSRADELRSLTRSPIVSGVSVSYRLASMWSAGLALLASILLIALTSRRRRTDHAFLGTLGTRRRQLTAMTFFEVIPSVLLTVAFGGVLGAGLARIAAPGINLSAFAGDDVTTRITANMSLTVAIGLAVVVGTAIGVIAASRQIDDEDASGVLRFGGET